MYYIEPQVSSCGLLEWLTWQLFFFVPIPFSPGDLFIDMLIGGMPIHRCNQSLVSGVSQAANSDHLFQAINLKIYIELQII